MSQAAAPNPYAMRRQDLRQLVRAMGEARAADRATTAGTLLVAAGDLLRRTRATRPDLGEVDAALRVAPRDGVEAWIGSVDVARCEDALEAAMTEAVEAAMSETPDEARLWMASVVEALAERDRLESAKIALARWVELRREDGDVADVDVEMLEGALREVDARVSPRARWLVGANRERRVERDLLDPAFRDAAWWFTRRAGCDPLTAVLAGGVPPTRHVDQCAECREDLRRARVVDRPPVWHVRAEERMRYELGIATADERTRIEAHTARCPSCSEALRVAEDAEGALYEAH